MKLKERKVTIPELILIGSTRVAGKVLAHLAPGDPAQHGPPQHDGRADKTQADTQGEARERGRYQAVTEGEVKGGAKHGSIRA